MMEVEINADADGEEGKDIVIFKSPEDQLAQTHAFVKMLQNSPDFMIILCFKFLFHLYKR